MYRIQFVSFIFTIFLVSMAQALSLEELVPYEIKQALIKDGVLKEFSVGDYQLALVPDGNSAVGMSEALDVFKPTILVESLFLYEKGSVNIDSVWNTLQQSSLFNVLCSISTLSGIEYYSASRKRMRIFYDTSYIVDGPEGEIPLPDPVFSKTPEKTTLYAIQKDLTFGENRYRYDYEAKPEYIRFTQENLTTMHLGLVPLLGKGKLRTTVTVIDAERYLLIYAISAAKTPLIPGLERKLRDSFSNRADAIYGWFIKKANYVFSASRTK